MPFLGRVRAGDRAAVAAALDKNPELANAHDPAPPHARALHLAAEQGDLALVELLLAAGATVDARDANAETPLYRAVVADHPDVVERLLAAGADPTLRTAHGGRSPFDAAVALGRHAIAATLRRHRWPSRY
jgi:ankyrin repeat protein